ncbi:F-box/kelch-repeat protein At1g16250 [Nicotiana tabacum]|nr:PREDICTED: F-box/kelch-repeat protein At1g16250-like [Nicotiana sylvestris]
MGSISSPSRNPIRFQENEDNYYRIYASFCEKDYTPNVNMSNWISCYHPSTNSWHRLTSIPDLLENQVLKGFSIVSIGETIYVIGGRHCHKVVGDDSVHERDINVKSSVLKYNTRTDTWSTCAPLVTQRYNFACTCKDGKIYVAGGQTTLDSAEGTCFAEVYDPAIDEWKQLPNMSTLRYKSAGVAWQGKIYVVGGFAKRGNSDSQGPYMMERSSAELYDPQKEKWEYVARMWDLDIPPNQIVNVNGKLFSSGDCLNAWKGHIEAYDENLNIWSIVDGSHSPISTSDATEAITCPPMQRIFCTMAPIGTKLYFLAGYKMQGEISRTKTEVHVFDTSATANGWRSFEPIEDEGEKELCSHCCVLKLD